VGDFLHGGRCSGLKRLKWNFLTIKKNAINGEKKPTLLITFKNTIPTVIGAASCGRDVCH